MALAAGLFCGRASAADAGNGVTVMSFNVLRDAWAKPGDTSWANRKVDVFATIQRKSPDFVATQEEGGGQMEEMPAALPDYHEVPGREISSGILYLHEKWALLDHGLTRFVRYDEGNSKDRYFIWGLFSENSTSRMIYIYSLHLPYAGQATPSDRVAGMAQVAMHVAARKQQSAPVILAGDFNSTADIDNMRTLTGKIGDLPIKFIYAYKDVEVRDVSYGIDHILALPGTTVRESGVVAGIWTSGSDHPAVYAVIEP